jgi:hypothetical protein
LDVEGVDEHISSMDMGAFKAMTTPGDTSMASLGEVGVLVNGGSVRARR